MRLWLAVLAAPSGFRTFSVLVVLQSAVLVTSLSIYLSMLCAHCAPNFELPQYSLFLSFLLFFTFHLLLFLSTCNLIYLSFVIFYMHIYTRIHTCILLGSFNFSLICNIFTCIYTRIHTFVVACAPRFQLP